MQGESNKNVCFYFFHAFKSRALWFSLWSYFFIYSFFFLISIIFVKFLLTFKPIQIEIISVQLHIVFVQLEAILSFLCCFNFEFRSYLLSIKN